MKYSGNDIVVYGTYNYPMFCANEIAKVLDIKKISSSIKDYNEKFKVTRKIQTNGGIQDVSMLTEHGLYKLLFSSKKTVSVRFSGMGH
jgi:prophage antirepressor-like protein